MLWIGVLAILAVIVLLVRRWGAKPERTYPTPHGTAETQTPPDDPTRLIP